MIAFTVKDFNDKESLNYRKTSRQLFMYKVGNGVLLQSRLYDSEISGDPYGGVEGKADDIPKYKTYRELIEREIAECEKVPNFWGKADDYNYGENCYEITIHADRHFGGYPDWLHFPRLTKITVLKGFEKKANNFTVGESGLCLECGGETEDSKDLLCEDCTPMDCDECGEYYPGRDITEVINRYGNTICVCENCREREYFYCERCGRWHHIDDYAIDGLCEECAINSGEYVRCEDCGEWTHFEYAYWVDGHHVCEGCIGNYRYCDNCDEYYHCDYVGVAHNADGEEKYICDDCRENGDYVQCDECGEWWAADAVENGLCPECSAEKESEKEKSA